MNWLINQLAKIRFLKGDFDYNLVRASMVIIYFFFGYQKWFDYEAKELVPFFTHGPLIFWMYPVFGIQGSTYFLVLSEWLIGALFIRATLADKTARHESSAAFASLGKQAGFQVGRTLQ
jgi:uncharacterized membrane protein YkgB